MPPILTQKKDRDALVVGSGARTRLRRRDLNPRVAGKGGMESSGEESGRRGVFSTSRDLTFSRGEWREREVMETAVIMTEPRGREKLERDDGDSGISETAVEERLLPPSPGARIQRESAAEFAYAKKESVLETLIQVFIPFMIAGFGMMAAGLLLDAVQHWDVYSNINEIFILVPALLGLKGNLEMTLASRLSTAANVGQLSTWRLVWRATWGNLSLIQGQALVVAALATAVSIVFGRDLHVAHMLLLGASSLSTAAIASLLLGAVMIAVIVISYIVRINPDNVATPIAASLGDLVTLSLLSIIANWLYDLSGPLSDVAQDGSGNGTDIVEMATPGATITASSLILLLLLALIPLWLYLAHRNSITRSVLFYGWVPVIAAMCISSGGGLVLSKAVSRWKGIAIYSPIINGVGGNLVAVQASRISTSLHATGAPGKSPDLSSGYKGPIASFFSTSQHATTAKLLVFLVIPGSAIFLSVIHVLNAGHTTLSPMFFFGYLICAVLQVVILLAVADWLVHTIWRHGFDPDNVAIPFLTSLGDLLGTGFLALGFQVMWYLGDRDEDVGE